MKYIFGLGSNLGDRKANIQAAISLLPINDVMVSSFHETSALLLPNSPDLWNINFLNIVISGNSDLQPFKMLTEIKRIEKIIGRQERQRWAPREIDIDILFAGGNIVESAELKIPHAEFQNRSFTKEPAAEIEPDFIHPVLKLTLKEIMEGKWQEA